MKVFVLASNTVSMGGMEMNVQVGTAPQKPIKVKTNIQTIIQAIDDGKVIN